MIFLAIVGAVSAEHAHSSQHIHKHDGHHEIVTHGHKHEHHDYYVCDYTFFIKYQSNFTFLI